MKKYLSIILTVLVAVSVLTGSTGENSESEQGVVSDTNTPISTSEVEEMPDDPFSKEDYQKLLALRFDGYENMTVAEYQDKVWELTDTWEYRTLLERFSKDETLYQMKDSDETAYFLFYVLEPFTAENWRIRSYSGATASDFPAPFENATLEYTFTLTILDADTLTVKDYNDTRLGVMNIMQGVLENKTKEELRNEVAMQADIQAYVDDALQDMQTTKISVAIEYAYFPLSAESGDNEDKYFDANGEQRRFPNGTEEDYRTLLALKAPDYENMSLADFNSGLLDWANEDNERMERVSEDAGWSDFQVTLTDEELSFVKLTVFLSGMENGKAIQSSYAGQPISPYYEEELPQKTTDENGAAWCSLYYQFSYSISDTEKVTVGERDRQIKGMINAIHSFWNDTDIETILKMSESDIVKELENIAVSYSTDYITITTNEEQVHFERMDERLVVSETGRKSILPITSLRG